MNFTNAMTPSVDGKWGNLEADNVTWNGLIGMLARREVDVAASSLTITKDRQAVADFTTALDDGSLLKKMWRLELVT